MVQAGTRHISVSALYYHARMHLALQEIMTRFRFDISIYARVGVTHLCLSSSHRDQRRKHLCHYEYVATFRDS
jgi:hypothetical protein